MLCVLTAIKLDREAQCWGIEIEYEAPDGVLPAKIHTELPITQFLPKTHFDFGVIASKISRAHGFCKRSIKSRS